MELPTLRWVNKPLGRLIQQTLHKRKLSSAQIILFGFALVILIGALLLMLPLSSKTGTATPFLDCLFTSTSVVCVTGLIVYDTATHWSYFGQAVILMLIQIGGMGVITVAAAITMASGKKISPMQRSTMRDAISAHQVGGIVKFTGFILKGILLVELIGALLLMTVFVPDFGRWTAIRCSADHILDYIEIDGDHAIFEVSIPKAWLGKTVGQLDIRKKFSINILAVKTRRKLDSFITPDTMLNEEKTLMVMGKYKDLPKGHDRIVQIGQF